MVISDTTSKNGNDCPFLNQQRNACLANNRRPDPGQHRFSNYCCNDNFDNCPSLLTYLLLHSSTKSRHSCQDEFLVK